MAKKRANGEGTIRKRSDNCWEARYSVDGKRHSLFAKSQKEARKMLTEVMSTIDNGEYLEETEMSVAQWMQTWTRDFLGSVKTGTKEGYEAVVKNHIIPCLGSIRMKDLQLLTVQRFVNRLSEKGMNPKTVKNVHGILHRGLQMAVRIGYLKKNPSDGIILPRIEQEEVHPLDKPELSKLLKSIQGHEHEVLINTAIFTGMRSGELLGLTWDCVDFDRGVIYVKKQLLQSRKKEDGFRFGTPKNGKGRVIMPAPLPDENAEEAQNRPGFQKAGARTGVERRGLSESGFHASGRQPSFPGFCLEDPVQDAEKRGSPVLSLS